MTYQGKRFLCSTVNCTNCYRNILLPSFPSLLSLLLFSQAKRILTLFQERRVLRHVMKVPEELRRNKAFDSNYCALVRALVPTRSRSSGSQPPTTPTETTPTKTTPTEATPTKTTPPLAALPPRKPQRKNRLRRSTVASGESSNVLEVSNSLTGL